MKLHIEIHSFSHDQAHGAIVLHKDGEPSIIIPISMPQQSFDTATEAELIAHSPASVLTHPRPISESEVFYTYERPHIL